MFSVILISPSASSSSDCSFDDPVLVVDLIATAGFFCMEGTPTGTLTSLFCNNLDGSFPEGTDSTYKIQRQI